MADHRLLALAPHLGDPSLYFVDDAWRRHPLVIEHATGRPRFALVDGHPVRFDKYIEPKVPPAPTVPDPNGMDSRTEPGRVVGFLEVTNP